MKASGTSDLSVPMAPTRRRRLLAFLGAVLAAAILGNAAYLLEAWRFDGVDPRLPVATAFRTGALAIDPVEDWRMGVRRGLDCALLQADIPAEAPATGLGLANYSDPRGLAEDCEILRDLAVRDPIARYAIGFDNTDIALGHRAGAWLLTLAPLVALRWAIAGLWLGAAMIGLVLSRPNRNARRDMPDAGDPAGLMLGPLLAAGCLWLIGPSLSAALPVTLLLVLAAWAGASRAGPSGTAVIAALFGAGLALTEYRAPMTGCGLAILIAQLWRHADLKSTLAPAAAFLLGTIAAMAGHDILAVWSGPSSFGALADALVNRLDPAGDPLDPALLPAMILDSLDQLVPGPRSVALAIACLLGFGLTFAPALVRASQRRPMPAGRAYAALVGLLPLVPWVIWFGGRSALGVAEGGVMYALLLAVSVAALLHWLGALAALVIATLRWAIFPHPSTS